jgi:hypothetical protein
VLPYVCHLLWWNSLNENLKPEEWPTAKLIIAGDEFSLMIQFNFLGEFTKQLQKVTMCLCLSFCMEQLGSC